MGTFSVVKTTSSSGDIEISCVPDLWISKGFLYWPPGRNVSQKAQKSIIPEKDWSRHPCTIVRDNIGNSNYNQL